MAWSYRKRIKIAPGVHLNVSKKGFSTTFGTRGASITSGRNGTYLNTGIPGTGIYNRRKIGGNTNIPQNEGCYKMSFIFILFALTVWFIIVALFEFESSTFFIGAGVILFVVLILLIIDGIERAMLPKKQKKQAQALCEAQIKYAKTAIYKEKDPTKHAILQNFLSCFELHQKVDETEAIIEALKSRIRKKSKPKLKEQLKIYETKLSELFEELNTVQMDIDEDLSNSEQQRYSILCESFEKLLSCKQIWIIASGTKKEINFDTGIFNYIKSSFDTPILRGTKGDMLYIYYRYIIKAQSPTRFEVFPIETVAFTFSTHILTETATLPEDAHIMYYTYKHTNKDGTPDKRYSYNPRYPVVKYGIINIEKFGLQYYISNYLVAEQFVNTYNSYRARYLPDNSLLKAHNAASNIISEPYFNTINAIVETIVSFYNDLRKRESLHPMLKATMGILLMKINRMEFAEKIRIFLLIDIIKCYNELGYSLNLKSREGFGLILLLARIMESIEPVTYSSVDMILSDSFAKPFDDYVKQTQEIMTLPEIQFVISRILAKYDTDLQKQYHVLLYRFASVMAKADGVITETEQKWLSELLKLDETEEKTPCIHQHTKIKKSRFDSQTELQSLTGLSSVKAEISTLVNFLKIQKERQSKGLKTSQPSYHCVFTGNPGTGKTTVARIVAEIYRELDILKKGHLIETDRSGLIAEYVGQTAVKTNKIIDSALDGVLFIDEAYSLIGGGDNDYGKEAIATLLKRMEDDRNRLVVILAGYTAEMKDFINSNSGLQSRFNRYIDFPDYSAEELCQIFELNLKKFDYTISDEASKTLKEYFQTKVSEKDNNFGNARFVRNLFEKTLEHQANRLAKETNLTTEKLSEISIDDINIIK